MNVFVDYDSPLSRFALFPEIRFHNIYVTSIELLFWYICLIQHSLPILANRLLSKTAITNNPCSASVWVRHKLEQWNVQIAPAWVFKAHHVYFAILCKLMRHGENPFCNYMVQLIKRYGSDLEFCVVTGHNCFVWACGLRRKAAERSGGAYPGENLYGRLLKCLAEQYASMYLPGSDSGQFELQFTLPELLAEPCLPYTTFKYTVLLLGDSQFRLVRHINGGKVFSRSGATLLHLAQILQRRGLVLSDFHCVIISGGVNDARRSKSYCERWWRQIRNALWSLANTDSTQVIMHSPIGVPRTAYAAEYTLWLREQFHRSFPWQSFHYVDWFTASADNPFLADNGAPVTRYLHRDHFHVNQTGFKKLWRASRDLVPKLRTVAIGLSNVLYPNGSAQL